MRRLICSIVALAMLSGGLLAGGIDLKVDPSQRKGIKVSAVDEGADPKDPRISIRIVITRKSQEAADPATFAITVKDANGKELATKDRKVFILGRPGTARWLGVVEMTLKPPPALPVTVVVKDPQEEKELEFEVKPEAPAK